MMQHRIRNVALAAGGLVLAGVLGCAENNDASSGIVSAPPPAGQNEMKASNQAEYGKIMQKQASAPQNLQSQGYPGAGGRR